MDAMTRKEFIQAALCSDTDNCILWPYAVRRSSGYGAYSESRTNYDAHRFVCMKAHGPSELQAAHSCGNKLCVNPRHLRWATAEQNLADAKGHKVLRGGGRYRQRFFAKERRDIIRSQESILALADRYRTDASYISRIRRGANA